MAPEDTFIDQEKLKNAFKGPQKGANRVLSIHDMLVILCVPKGPTRSWIRTVNENLTKKTWMLTLGTLLQNRYMKSQYSLHQP